MIRKYEGFLLLMTVMSGPGGVLFYFIIIRQSKIELFLETNLN